LHVEDNNNQLVDLHDNSKNNTAQANVQKEEKLAKIKSDIGHNMEVFWKQKE